MASTTIAPAYGRDYKSQAEVKAAWNEGKDFKVHDFFNPWNGAAVSIRESADLISQGYDSVTVRYARLTKAVVIKLERKAVSLATPQGGE